MTFTNELKQFQSTFDAVNLDEKASKPKKAWTPPFKINDNDEAIITVCCLTTPPWDNDDGIYLRVQLEHEISGTNVNNYYPMTPKSDGQARFVKSQLKKLGYDLDEQPVTGVEDWAPSIEGARVGIFTKLSEYKGRIKYSYYINEILDKPAPIDPMDDIPF